MTGFNPGETAVTMPPTAPWPQTCFDPIDWMQGRTGTGFNPGETAVTMAPTAPLAANLGHPIDWMHGRTG